MNMIDVFDVLVVLFICTAVRGHPLISHSVLLRQPLWSSQKLRLV